MDLESLTAPVRRRWRVAERGNQVEFAGLEFGDPQAAMSFVFLHANGFNAFTYRSILEGLPRQIHGLAIDMRGHGLSPNWVTPGDKGDWLDLRDDILALLPRLSNGPVVMAGHSMGGAVSLLTAIAAPTSVRSLVLFDPVPSPDELQILRAGAHMGASSASTLRRRRIFESRDDAFARLAGRGVFATWPGSVLRDYLEDGLRPLGDDGFELSCPSELEARNFETYYDPLEHLSLLKTPTTILRAATGSACSIRSATDLPGCAACRVMTVSGTSHSLPMERPDLVRDALLQSIE